MRAITIAAALAATFAAMPAAADIEDPECIAPAQPGGGFDLTCRVAQAGLEPQLGEPMAVTFMPGGIGAVAINLFNTTRTDDPSAIVAFSSGSLLNMATGKYGEWDEDDVRFLATAGADFGAVIVQEDGPYESLGDVMAALEEDASGVVMGAGGSVGSQDWMKAALLMRDIGLDPREMRYVAYDGGGAAKAGLLGGQIEVYLGDVAEMAGDLGAGGLKILAVMSPERLPEPFADIPTVMELGHDVEWTILRGFYMGKEVADEDYQAWVDAFQQAYGTEQWAQVQKERGLLPLNMAGEELQASVMQRVAAMRDIAREAGLIE
jgi:putative tricarboxylic transport membrane protein